MKTAPLVSALILACSPTVPTRRPADPDPIAYQILSGARRALGETERVETIATVARVRGPHGSFETRVYSARDGRARLDLGGQFLGGVGACHGWLVDDAAGRVRPLDLVNRSVVRGHELHMLVLAPETRWKKPLSRGIQTWNGEAALMVEFRDDLGERAALYLRPSDTLPLGLELVNHTGYGAAEVEVTLSDWKTVQGVRLFRRAVFAHGGDRYEYEYTDVQLNPVIETFFEAPRQLAGDPHLHR
jgi:hypothetical protein